MRQIFVNACQASFFSLMSTDPHCKRCRNRQVTFEDNTTAIQVRRPQIWHRRFYAFRPTRFLRCRSITLSDQQSLWRGGPP